VPPVAASNKNGRQFVDERSSESNGLAGILFLCKIMSNFFL
jgi:hypothetical protein